MSIVSLECGYIIERIRSIAFQVGAFLGDDCQYSREKQAQQMVDVVVGGGAKEIGDDIFDRVLYAQEKTVQLESTQFFEVLRFARQYFTQKVLDAIQLETKHPRASFMVFKRRILDVEAHIENDIVRIDFVVDKERYPIRVSYRLGTQKFLADEWLGWFETTLDSALLKSGDFAESVKAEMRGRSLCFLKYFHEYRNGRPVFWTYNRLHIVREALIEQFHIDVEKGYVRAYKPELWERQSFDNIRTFLRREGCPEKLFCTVGKHTFIFDSALSERDIFISLQTGKSERIQGILNATGLSLRSAEHFVVIQQLLKRLDANPLAELSRLGRESKHCTVCNRKLDSDSSIAQGMGPVCASKIHPKQIQQSLF
jgi:hypothetical protein